VYQNKYLLYSNFSKRPQRAAIHFPARIKKELIAEELLFGLLWMCSAAANIRSHIAAMWLARDVLPSYDTTLKDGNGIDYQLIYTLCYPARRTHYSLAIISDIV